MQYGHFNNTNKVIVSLISRSRNEEKLHVTKVFSHYFFWLGTYGTFSNENSWSQTIFHCKALIHWFILWLKILIKWYMFILHWNIYFLHFSDLLWSHWMALRTPSRIFHWQKEHRSPSHPDDGYIGRRSREFANTSSNERRGWRGRRKRWGKASSHVPVSTCTTNITSFQ